MGQRLARYFDRSELARRYHVHRPRLHARAIREILATRPARTLNTVLDVACGTGHSTTVLTTLAPTVLGCDASPAMLSVARTEVSTAEFVCSQAETLPFSAHVFDLVTASMGFHWFSQERFLEEAGRILATDGELWVYNFVFPGILVGDDAFSEWHRERYLARYPVPARSSETVAGLLRVQRSSLVFVAEHRFQHEVTLTTDRLRNYLTTQSNVEAALRRGESLPDIDAWLDKELAPFFRERDSHRFVYVGHAEVAAAA